MSAPRHPRPSRATALLVIVVLMLSAGALLLSTQSASAAMSVSVVSSTLNGSTLSVTLRVSAGPLPLQAHVALVPSLPAANTDPTVLYFSDASYHTIYGSLGDIDATGTRITSYLQLMGSSDEVSFVDGPALPEALELHPHGALVFVGTGAFPDFVYSQNSTLLSNWLHRGGTLFWAGGPLGYTAGHPAPNGFAYDNLGWLGQQTLAGFPVSDPFNLQTPSPGTGGPAFVSVPTPLSTALALVYDGAPVGANASEVVGHGGVVLGAVTALATPPGTPAPRTSLAYFPVGSGAVFYFGGALFESPQGYVPDASVELSQDIATLLALPERPAPGATAVADVDLGSFQSRTTTLVLANATSATSLIVRSEMTGSQLTFWAGVVHPSSTTASSATTASSRAPVEQVESRQLAAPNELARPAEIVPARRG